MIRKILVLTLLIPVFLQAQNKETVKVKLGGFITTGLSMDSRKSVNSRYGDVFLYPAPKNLDSLGNDLNARPELFMASIHSRLKVAVSGMQAFGADASAVLEGDFIGTATDKTGLLRLRHAYIKLDWGENELIAGKYWHPMFVTSCFPAVMHWGAAIPFHVLSRAPQLRYTHQFSKGYVLFALLSEMDFSSTGPDGKSAKYVQQAAIPEVSGQVKFDINSRISIGATAGYKFLKPYVKNAKNIKTDQLLGSLQTNAWVSYKTGQLACNLQGIYGQNMYNFVMLGGYGVKAIKDNGDYEYSNINTSSVWTNIYTTKGAVRYGFFAGYTKNMGSEDKLISTFSRGSNIDYLYQFAPKVEWHSGRLMLGTQLLYTVAAYGTKDSDAKVSNASEVAGVRVVLQAKYSF